MPNETLPTIPSARKGQKGFTKGLSGNSRGRAKGSRNKATILAEQLIEGEGEAITRKCIELAKGGDPTALRLVMERLLPRRRGRPIQINLPRIECRDDLAQAFDVVLDAMASGDVSPDEATMILPLLERKLQVAEARTKEELPPWERVS